MRVLSGLILVVAMLAGFGLWLAKSFLLGAFAFVSLAIVAGTLHNRGDAREAGRHVQRY